MKMDFISRKVLSPAHLMTKRRQEYKYAVEQSREYNGLMIRAHVGGGRNVFNPKLEPSIWLNLSKDDEPGMKNLIDEIMDAKKLTPVIVAIEQDLADDVNPNMYHLFLAFPPESSEGLNTPQTPTSYRRMRVPLVSFCELLSKAYEEQMSSTALCFIADATCALGSDVLTSVIEAANHGVATVSSPAWMTSLSSVLLSKNTNGITTEQFEQIIFSLCRLEAWRVRGTVGISRTVLITLPGQACVPLLLPLV